MSNLKTLTPIKYVQGFTNENIATGQLLYKCTYSLSENNKKIRDDSLYSFDLIPWRPGGQIILHTNAYARASCNSFICSIQGPNIDHKIKVIGQRTGTIKNKKITLSKPHKFTYSPLYLSYGFGGYSAGVHYPDNPIGSGFLLFSELNQNKSFELPTLEDPEFELKKEHFAVYNYDHLPKPYHAGFIPAGLTTNPYWNSHRNLCSNTFFPLNSAFKLTNLHPTKSKIIAHLPEVAPKGWIKNNQEYFEGTMQIRDIIFNPIKNTQTIIWTLQVPLQMKNYDDKIQYDCGIFKQ